MNLRQTNAGRRTRGAASGADATHASPLPLPGELTSLIRSMHLTARTGRHIVGLLGRVDHVTLLPNRVQFIEDMDARMTGRGETARRSTVLLLVTLTDAQNFNQILRALGHSYSEDFIRAGAERIRSVLGAGSDIYHVSVLSFALVVDDSGGDEARRIAETLIDAFAEPLSCQDIPIDTRAGVGLARFGDRVEAPAELLRECLTAAQDSRAGEAGWAWYDRESDEDHVRSFRLLSDLKSALTLDDGQLSMQFQPRVDLRTSQAVGVEALLRWHHPGLGLISPGEFIPLAETSALIGPLTRWVVSHVLGKAMEWHRKRIPLMISMNVSPKNIVEPTFVEFVLSECGERGVEPSTIELEFTEGALTMRNRLTVGRMQALRDAGVRLAIDDFGSGYSNMSYLASLPTQILKIDQSFIRPLDQKPRNATLIQAIIALGHDLGYRVVGEGIETGSAYRKLAEWGCDEGQGFLISRPLSEADLHDWYRSSILARPW